jgi:tryptophan-rich sensory protein
VEVSLLIAGTIIVAPNLGTWQFADRKKPNYCEFGMVVFVCVVIGLAWTYMFLAALCALYVIFIANRQEDEAVVLPTINVQKMAEKTPEEHAHVDE